MQFFAFEKLAHSVHPVRSERANGSRLSRCAERAKRAERSRLEAPVSQRPIFKTLSHSCAVLFLTRRTQSFSRTVPCNAQRPYSRRSHSIALLTLGYAKLVPLVLLICLHDVALQATRPCVVGVTPSVTPPRWFLVI